MNSSIWNERLAVAKRRAFIQRSTAQHLQRANSSGNLLRQTLSTLDLTFLGIGSIIGAGVYVLSGVTAKDIAGPSVVLSYLIAATAALLSALSYSEFAVDLPLTGGAFNYICVTFGEGVAWTVAWNMLLETGLSSAAVSRGFSGYLATLIGKSSPNNNHWLVTVGPLEMDFLAPLLIAILTVVLMIGTKTGSRFNAVVCCLNISVILFVVIAGLPKCSADNLVPFAPFGVEGVFSAASIVFFSYIGFDYIANAAEEAQHPEKSLPYAILASLGVATFLYVLMSVIIVAMVPYTNIAISAPFSSAFLLHNAPWVAKIVSFGALFGITTSTMTGLLSQARLFVVLGRERLLPAALGRVSLTSGVPIIATFWTGVTSGMLGILLDISVLAELVSVGTLYVFFAVCAGVLYRRYAEPGEEDGANRDVILRITAITAFSLAFTISFQVSSAPWWVAALFLLGWLLSTLSMLFSLSVLYTPTKFEVPFFPFTPALGILFNVHLIGSLGWISYVRFAVWMVIGVLIYLFYGANGAEELDEEMDYATGLHQVGGRKAKYSSTIRYHEATDGRNNNNDNASGDGGGGGGGGGVGRSGKRGGVIEMRQQQHHLKMLPAEGLQADMSSVGAAAGSSLEDWVGLLDNN
jgi:basic amino acid/polyamine antiporter, APA family